MAIIPSVRCRSMRKSLEFYAGVLDFESVDGDDSLDDPSFSVISRDGARSSSPAIAGTEPSARLSRS
jgi:hypothetical protein